MNSICYITAFTGSSFFSVLLTTFPTTICHAIFFVSNASSHFEHSVVCYLSLLFCLQFALMPSQQQRRRQQKLPQNSMVFKWWCRDMSTHHFRKMLTLHICIWFGWRSFSRSVAVHVANVMVGVDWLRCECDMFLEYEIFLIQSQRTWYLLTKHQHRTIIAVCVSVCVFVKDVTRSIDMLANAENFEPNPYLEYVISVCLLYFWFS